MLDKQSGGGTGYNTNAKIRILVKGIHLFPQLSHSLYIHQVLGRIVKLPDDDRTVDFNLEIF